MAIPAEEQTTTGEVSNISPRETYLQANAGRYEKEYADKEPVNAKDQIDSDIEHDIPDDSLESDAGDDGALAATDQTEDDSDIDEDTPEGSDVDEGAFEDRYKELQATYTETSQELSALRKEMTDQAEEFTRARFDIQDKVLNVEKAAEFWANMAQGDLQRLEQVNVSQLNQEQYTQWQQQRQIAVQIAQQRHQALALTQEQAQAALKTVTDREVQISRSRLERSIDDFDNAYPEIGKFAVSQGVNQQVFRDIKDPGLIELIHRHMKTVGQPDAIKTIKTKTKAKNRQAKVARGRDERGRFSAADQKFRSARNSKERKQAFLNRENDRFAREYGPDS